MSKNVKPIPDEYEGVIPYLIVKGGADAIEFYKKVFGATEVLRMADPDGTVRHAEIKIGNRIVMLSDENPEMKVQSPQSGGSCGMILHLYVNDVDSTAKQVEAAGGKMIRPVENLFYGDRSCFFVDPFGHSWHVATHIEDLSPEEIHQRAQQWKEKQAK